jgi:P27 family predicted phage terminase small subunit
VLRGNPGKRRYNLDEPTPEPAGPSFDTPPPELDEDPTAIREWARLAPLLRVCGIVTEAERSVLLALCQQWSRLQDAQTKIRAGGMVVKRGDGSPMLNPYLKVADAAFSNCARLWAELGLTPSGRARLSKAPSGGRVEPVSKWGGLV